MSATALFVLAALLIVAITVAFLVWPFLRRREQAAPSRQALTAALYRDQLAELERDRANGTLSANDFEEAKTELQRRLLEDSQGEAPPPAAAPSRALPIALASGIPLAALLLYMAIGTPAALEVARAERAPHGHGEQMTRAEIEQLVAGFAAKMEKDPDNYPGWAMLGRSYKMLGNFDAAVRAYERTGPLLENNAELIVDYADALAATEGFSPKVMQTLERALKLDPHQLHGLWLRGTAYYERKQYAKAIKDWETLHRLLPPDSREAQVIAANLAEARSLQANAAAKK